MFTICPKCTLTLAVTANDLRLGQGYVRCGRCATVFNALVSLSEGGSRETEGTQANQVLTLPEESANDAGLDGALLRLESSPPAESLEATQEAVVDAPPRIETTAEEVADDIDVEPEPESEPAPEPTTEQISLTADAGDDDDVNVDAEAVVADTEVDEQRAPSGTGTVETIVLEGEGVTQTEEYVDIETIDSELAEAARQVMTASQPAPFGMAGGEEITLATPDQTSDEPEEPAGELPDDELMADGQAADEATEVEPAVPAGALPEGGAPGTDDETLGLYRPRVERPPRAPHKIWWVAASTLLALILTVQIVHHYRNDLAARPSWYNGLSRTYGFLGLPLTPNWDLRGYDVRQLGAATNGSNDNAIRVRISLANRTSNEQPYPILRLSLFDRFGKRVAARDLQPADYLHAVPEAGKLMSGGQRVDTEVAVLDPGPDASSFELDVCLAGARGLRCANDEPLRSGSRS